MTDDDAELITADERADIAALVAALPTNLDLGGGPALRELRERWGIEAGHIWPSVRRLDLAVRVVVDRRRRQRAHAGPRLLAGAPRLHSADRPDPDELRAQRAAATADRFGRPR